MDIGENLDWIGDAIIDAEMRILCGLPQVTDPKIPFYIFDSHNADDAGKPPQLSQGYGDCLHRRLREALEAEVTAPALAFSGLSKTFGGQQALRAVDFSVAPGEVHGLLGQNGSGKSTLIKILAGFHAPDPGATLRIAGQDVPLPLPPGGVRPFGVAFVHQHLGLIPPVTVLENLLLTRLSGRGGIARPWAINWARERSAARRLFERYGLDIDPGVPLSPSVLGRARAGGDRPRGRGDRRLATPGSATASWCWTSPRPFLPRADVDRLFTLVRRVVANGASVIFVSHDIDEVLEITDRATVLARRAGRGRADNGGRHARLSGGYDRRPPVAARSHRGSAAAGQCLGRGHDREPVGWAGRGDFAVPSCRRNCRAYRPAGLRLRAGALSGLRRAYRRKTAR